MSVAGSCGALCYLAAWGVLAASYVTATVILGPVIGGVALATAAVFAEVVLGVSTLYGLIGACCGASCGRDGVAVVGVPLAVIGTVVVPLMSAAILNAANGTVFSYGVALAISFTGLGLIAVVALPVMCLMYSSFR